MRRILSVIPAPTYGGAANQLLTLAGPLRERGWETVAVIPAEPGNVADRLGAGGVEAHAVRMPRLRASADPRRHASFCAGMPPAVRALQELIRQTGAVAVQNHGDLNPHAALAGHRERVGVVWQILDTRTPERLRPFTARLVTAVADSVTTWGGALAASYRGVRELGDRHVVVFPPVDATVFRPRPEAAPGARTELGLPDGALCVAMVGNRNPQKGLEWFVRAGARVRKEMPHVHLRILGSPSPGHGSYEAAVVEEADALGLGDALAIHDPGPRVPELMHGIDVLVVSSVPRSEGMPTVIAEAMACGIPVVATDVGAVVELVDHEVTGLVVRPLDAGALAAGIGVVAASPELRERMAAAARARMEADFSLGALADRHAAAYDIAVAHRLARADRTRRYRRRLP